MKTRHLPIHRPVSSFEIHNAFYREKEAQAKRRKRINGAMSVGAFLILAAIIGIMLFAMWHTWQAEHQTAPVCRDVLEVACR